ncbi:MAG: 5-formyltetrahydrofolate cyclo-ligase [Clostridiales Family XIII bacterium]|nr:5-formyltetrahydrofolate cyclo-ligase [Clostridiales Family XIII bacterium]
MRIKELLRVEYAARVAAFAQGYRLAADAAILDALADCEAYRCAELVFLYVGVRNEVATLPLVERALAEGRRVCVPVTFGDGVMEAREIMKCADLVRRTSGLRLLEPSELCPVTAPQEIDLAVVPCLSCDAYGNRLGYGGGYYDRYLKRVRKEAARIAVCRDRQLAMSLPRGEYDVPVDAIVTESGVRLPYSGR